MSRDDALRGSEVRYVGRSPLLQPFCSPGLTGSRRLPSRPGGSDYTPKCLGDRLTGGRGDAEVFGLAARCGDGAWTELRPEQCGGGYAPDARRSSVNSRAMTPGMRRPPARDAGGVSRSFRMAARLEAAPR